MSDVPLLPETLPAWSKVGSATFGWSQSPTIPTAWITFPNLQTTPGYDEVGYGEGGYGEGGYDTPSSPGNSPVQTVWVVEILK